MYPELIAYRARELRDEWRRANAGSGLDREPAKVFRLIQRVTHRAV